MEILKKVLEERSAKNFNKSYRDYYKKPEGVSPLKIKAQPYLKKQITEPKAVELMDSFHREREYMSRSRSASPEVSTAKQR